MMPTLFKIGPLEIHSYGFLWAVGILLAAYRASRVAKRYGFTMEEIIDVFVTTVLSGIVGARLLYVAMKWDTYRDNLFSIAAVWDGGLSFFGGLAAGLIAAYWLFKRRNIPYWHGMDFFVPSLALGYGVARLGCLFAGCCYGHPTALPWGLPFPNEQIPGALTPPSHPTQIYSFLAGLTIFVFLHRLDSRRAFEGQVAAGFLILFGIYRFINEFFRRGATSDEWFWGITIGQVAAFVIFALGVYFYWDRSRKGVSKPVERA